MFIECRNAKGRINPHHQGIESWRKKQFEQCARESLIVGEHQGMLTGQTGRLVRKRLNRICSKNFLDRTEIRQVCSVGIFSRLDNFVKI